MDSEMFKVYTASQLKKWLQQLGQRTTGSKSELVLRLLSVPENERGEFPYVEGKTHTETRYAADDDDDYKDSLREIEDDESDNENNETTGGSI